MLVKKHITTRHSITQLSAFIICLFFSSTGMSAIYKWVDANGEIHYGSQRPLSNKAERLKIRIREPDQPTTSSDDKKTNNGNSENAKKPKVKKPTLSRKDKKFLCKQAKADVADIKAKARFRIKGNDGKVRYLTQKEVDARLKASKKDVKELCR